MLFKDLMFEKDFCRSNQSVLRLKYSEKKNHEKCLKKENKFELKGTDNCVCCDDYCDASH